MAKQLIIVESPAKARTIYGYLGGNYDVIASKGHIFDLPNSEIGIDIDNHFEPQYIIMQGKNAVLQTIIQKAKAASEIIIATDPDREGEAIGYHIQQALSSKKSYRILFHEVTRKSITAALQNPGQIRMTVVEAQITRRLLDRLLGYTLSPFLWRTIGGRLSAGRVQSVVLRWICERQQERDQFVAKEYFKINGLAQDEEKNIQNTSPTVRKIQLCDTENKTRHLANKTEWQEFLQKMGLATNSPLQKDLPTQKILQVIKLNTEEKKQFPPYPYTTSSLQQDSFYKLGFSAKKTMMLAQKLYEGIQCGSMGRAGLITYMRTDATTIQPAFKAEIYRYIEQTFGKNQCYYGRKDKILKNAQQAHEAIRPTSLKLNPQKAGQYLKADEKKLYQLIWQRTIAAHMAPEVYNEYNVIMVTYDYRFLHTYREMQSAGFSQIYGRAQSEKQPFVPLRKGQLLKLLSVKGEKKKTEPPSLYNESSLVKKMEQSGIGRPSTYAPTIDKLLMRQYIYRQKKSLLPTELGKTVIAALKDNFTKYLQDEYTRDLEQQLDEIENNQGNRLKILQPFYQELLQLVAAGRKTRHIEKKLKTNQKSCPVCHKGSLINKTTAKGKKYLSCSEFPHCDYMVYL